MNKKRTIHNLLYSLLCIGLLLIFLPQSAAAAQQSGTCGENVEWTLNEEGVLTIYGEGEMENYTWTNFVPTNPWYHNRSSITKIIIKEGVTSVGNSAFYGLYKVKEVELPDSLLSLGQSAFHGCSGLIKIELPSNLQYIGYGCFEICSSLISVQIPDSVTKIGADIFYACTKLENVKLSSNLTELPTQMFWKCTSLKEIEIPRGVTKIGASCFEGCTALEKIDLPLSLETIKYDCFYGCTALNEIKIPDTVTTIEAEAFRGCSSLKKAELPANLTEITSGLFNGCTKLETVSLPINVKKISEEAFYNCTALTTLMIPESVVKIGKHAYGFRTNVVGEANQLIENAILFVGKGSAGETYAKEHGVKHSLIKTDVDLSGCVYTGKEVIPKITITIDNVLLREGKDFRISYQNNIEIGTGLAEITFIGSYDFIKSKMITPFFIGYSLESCRVIFDKEKYEYHTLLPEVTVNKDGNPLTLNLDYTLNYRLGDRTWEKDSETSSSYIWDVGTMTVHISGKGNYIGEKVIEVDVTAFDMAKAELWTNWVSEGNGVSSSSPFEPVDFLYDGTPKTQSGFRVCDPNDTIDKKYYEITYKNNKNAGTATMEISGKGPYYTGTLCKNFKITAKGIWRVAGATRYDTSYKIVDSMKEAMGVEKFDHIILASGNTFADALSGSYLASVKKAPIIIVNKSNLNSLYSYIRKNLNPKGVVYVLGGTAAVPEQVVTELRGEFYVKRLGGANRFETNLLILEEAGVKDEDILICTGLNFADSLSASATGRPMLLVMGSSLTRKQAAFLHNTTGKRYILGGENAVSKNIATQIGGHERIAGAGRFETSVMIAETFFNQVEMIVLASAVNFPDGLCGGPLAYVTKAPLILTYEGGKSVAKNYVTSNNVKAGIVLGGTAALTSSVIGEIFGR